MGTSDIIVVERALLKSKAFRSLCGSAKTIFFDFRMKCQITSRPTKSGRKKEMVILNNGKIEYTYSEAEKKGIPRSTFMRRIDELIEYGFLDVVHSGAGGVKGDKSLYAISDRWRKFGTQAFQKLIRPKDKRKGRGFKEGPEHWINKHGFQK